MVLLISKPSFSLKHFAKPKNHRNYPMNTSLLAFRSYVSNCLFELSSNSDSEYELLSLKWIKHSLEALRFVNKEFAKLIVEINYPMNKWEVSSIDEYLNYSMSLLELLNSMGSATSRLSRACSQASRLVANSPEKLKPLEKITRKDFTSNKIGERKDKFSSKNAMIFHEVLVILKDIGLWVCGVVISGLCGDAMLYLETKNSGRFAFPPVMALDLIVSKRMMENRGVAEELKEVNNAVASGENVEKLKTRLEVIEEKVCGIEEEASLIFSEVLAGRNEMLDILRHKKLYH